MASLVRDARIVVDGIGFDPITQAEALELVRGWVAKPQPKKSRRVVKPYVEFFESARRDERVATALNTADLVLADSVAVQWAASWAGEKNKGLGRFVWSLAVGMRQSDWICRVIPERGGGVNATHQWLLAASQHGWRVGILGGPRDTQKTQLALEKRYPMLQLAGVWSGYFEASQERKLVKELAAAKLDLLFVAMGHPKQELFMLSHESDRLAKVLVGEGGTFDFDEMGGPLRRAPKWVQAAGLEWLWRLLLQPRRIGRQLAIPRFMWRVYRSR